MRAYLYPKLQSMSYQLHLIMQPRESQDYRIRSHFFHIHISGTPGFLLWNLRSQPSRDAPLNLLICGRNPGRKSPWWSWRLRVASPNASATLAAAPQLQGHLMPSEDWLRPDTAAALPQVCFSNLDMGSSKTSKWVSKKAQQKPWESQKSDTEMEGNLNYP